MGPTTTNDQYSVLLFIHDFGISGTWMVAQTGSNPYRTSTTTVAHGSPSGSMDQIYDLVGQVVPQQVSTTCSVSSRVTPLLLESRVWWPTGAPCPLGPWPSWSTRCRSPTPWFRSIIQWARGSYNPWREEFSSCERETVLQKLHRFIIWPSFHMNHHSNHGLK